MGYWDLPGVLLSLDGYKKVTGREWQRPPRSKCERCGRAFPIMCKHHITYRADGGGDESKNIMEVCPNCHALIHEGFGMEVWDGEFEQGVDWF